MLFVDDRRVMISGAVDDATAAELCSTLVALDSQAPAPIEVMLNGSGGTLDGCAAALDVFSLLQAPIHATVLGRAEGPVGVLLACAPGDRRAAPNATISLRVDRSAGSAVGSIEQAAELLKQRIAQLATALAARTGADLAFAERELNQGVQRDAEAAKQANVVDSVLSA